MKGSQQKQSPKKSCLCFLRADLQQQQQERASTQGPNNEQQQQGRTTKNNEQHPLRAR